MAQGERCAPTLAPGLDVRVVIRPGEMFGQLLGNGVEMQCRVEVVPTEYLERRQVVAVLRVRKVGKADLPFVSFAIIGHKKQVVRGPGSPLRTVGGCSFF